MRIAFTLKYVLNRRVTLQIGKFSLLNLLDIDWWKCSFKYFRGVIRYTKGQYKSSNDDFHWILSNGSYGSVECLVHENLGINYARLKDFVKAEYHLLKSLSDKMLNQNGYLFMWLGYVYLVKESYEDSLYYFRKARDSSNKGTAKWLVSHKYVKEHIDKLEESIKEKYKEILTDN